MSRMLSQLIVFAFLFFSCGEISIPEINKSSSREIIDSATQSYHSLTDSSGTTLDSRFLLPQGYLRVKSDSNSFGNYLRGLPVKPEGSKVKYYNGMEKDGMGVYLAVIDLPIGKKDLHQCADAVMRFRAEYLYAQKQFDKIHFNFTNGFHCDYSEWMKGKRIVVQGNQTFWKQSANPSNTYSDFWNYMEMVFSYAGSLSLSKELKSVDVADMQIGDVFIIGGTPGHAEIVVDVAINPSTKQKIFMLAQSYMPAQETQILINPNDEKLSPWYSVDFGEALQTPEFIFQRSDLKRFQD